MEAATDASGRTAAILIGMIVAEIRSGVGDEGGLS